MRRGARWPKHVSRRSGARLPDAGTSINAAGDEYGWTFTGTSAETGKSVRVPGFEEWTIAPDRLIAASRGHYDQAEYDRQLQHGIGPTI
jgi:hypothetical protein